MITGWAFAFLAGVIMGVWGKRMRMPVQFNLALGFIVGIAIVVLCQNIGLP